MKKKLYGISLFVLSLISLPMLVLADEENIVSDNDDTQIVENQYEAHKVAVKVTKVDENNEPLKGATLQILDANGEIIEEWISEEVEHEIMLPEGEYTLHEVEAPEGYELALDQAFTVEAIQNEINADTNHDSEICDHYGGIPLYYVEVESQGVKQEQEVYCINQGWDEPDGLNYDGQVVTVDNITTFVPDYDKTMSNQELYDKVLDIIYHRSKVSEVFPDLSNVEIRYITEVALKNYTSAEYESRNGKDANGNFIMTKIFREYTYDSSVNSKYRITPGEGDAFGNLAKHWWVYHRNGNIRVTIPEKYAELYYYLVRDEDHHPSDMHLYVYSTNTKTSDGENYQNLLGVTWFNPYDDNHVIELTLEDKYNTEVTDVTIEKIWDDDDDRDGIRPENIDVTLSNGTTVTLNEENNWTATIEDLPVYDKGQKITYTWSEVSVDGYELTGCDVNGYVTTLTNSHLPIETEISIKKIWDDYDDISTIRPTEITVYLYADNEILKTIVISETDNWEITITGLNKYNNGVEIVYDVKEKEIPEYETYYDVDGNTFTITNHHELGKGGDTPEELPPQTGLNRNNNYDIVFIILSMLSLSFTIKMVKEN